jgi:cell wall-associated NlpC family hydrolase
MGDGTVDQAAAEVARKTGKVTGDKSWDEVIAPWLGTPYKYGGSSKSGIDCSAFVGALYKEKLGKSLPRTSREQFAQGSSVGSPQVGDLVFCKESTNAQVSHVGLFVGNNNFVHASSSAGVTVSSLSDSYWKPRYAGARKF